MFSLIRRLVSRKLKPIDGTSAGGSMPMITPPKTSATNPSPRKARTTMCSPRKTRREQRFTQVCELRFRLEKW